MSRQPNVLLLFTDQQRADSIGSWGNRFCRTPHLDRLTREGAAFTSTYTPCPVCIPARGCMHYGQYPQKTDSFENREGMPTDERPSFMDRLTDAGYRTHAIGKVHFSPDREALRGFQSRLSQEEMTAGPEEDDYLKFLVDNGQEHVLDPMGPRGEMYYIPQVSQLPPRLHPTQWVADRSLEFLDEQAGSKQPWMMMTSFIHPHPPFSPPSPWHKLYRTPQMPTPFLPPDGESLHTWVNRHQNRYKYRDQGMDMNLARTIIAYYHACVSYIDFQVGRILQALEASGELDNTLILYTSDHGELLGDYGCYGKRSFHDAASRVPMICRLPGRFDAGCVCPRPASLVDVMPTFLSAAGVDVPAACDGVDLAELAAGRSDREAVYCQHERREKATYTTVTDRWKYVYSAADRREMLFDRSGARGGFIERCGESRDCAAGFFERDVQQEMKGRTIEFLRGVGYTEGLDGEDFRDFEQPKIPENPDGRLLIQDAPWADWDLPGYGGRKQ